MTKINVMVAGEAVHNIVVHTNLAYEMQPVAAIKVTDNVPGR